MNKIVCVFLALVMIIGMLPCQILAETELTWSEGTITLASETSVGSYGLKTLSIYKQGAISSYPTIISATQDGNTINITLAEGTDLSYPLQMGFAGNGGYVQHSGNTCTLKNGKGTAQVTVIAKPAPVPNAPVLGSGTFTVKFSAEAGEVYDVTVPEGEGFTFTGESTVAKNQDYSFKVTAKEGYDVSSATVKVNGDEIFGTNGTYTVSAVCENLVITVEGVIKKSVYNVILTEGTGYTIAGQNTSYADEPYTFTVTVDDAVYWADRIEVKIDGEPVSLTDGKYTIDTLDSDKIITVENVNERKSYAVTFPEVEGVIVSGESEVREGKSYTFTVTVDEKYDDANINVKVNGNEVALADNKFTINSVSEDVTVDVGGIVKKEICEIIKPAGEKFTFAGEDFAYKGNDYVFTVTPNPGYVAAVTINNKAVEGNNNIYTVKAESNEMIIRVSIQRAAMPETELTITPKNDAYIVDVKDNKLAPFVSYHATVTDIKITGVRVVSAFEIGTTVYFNLHSDTPDDAVVNAEFLYTQKSCTLNGNIINIILESGEAGIKHTVSASYSNGWKTKSAEYTLVFFCEIPADEPPVCVKDTDIREVWKDRSIDLDLSEYFTDADMYYLVNDESKTQIEGKVYTFTSGKTGEHKLTFTAENEAGEALNHLTIIVNVKDIKSGVFIDHETGNGSWNYVQFLDAEGNYIEDVTASYDIINRVISVVLPKTYEINGLVKTKFDMTQNSDGYPFMSTSDVTTGNRAYGSRFAERNINLTNGSANLTFYYYNKSTSAVDNGGQTKFVISIKIKNDKPVLAEGNGTSATATITAGESYTLDLAPVFMDVDEDELAYKVSINDASFVTVDENYTFTTDVAGTYTLVFAANDGKDDSEDTYTVTLTVENSTITNSMTAYVPEGLNPMFYVSSGFADGIDVQGASIDAVVGESAGGMTAYTLNYPVNAQMLSVRSDGFGGMAFPVQKDGTISFRKVQFKVVDYDTNPADSMNTITYDVNIAVAGTSGWLLCTEEEYVFTAIPKNDNLAKVAKAVTIENGSETYVVNVMLGISNPVSITVPTGAKAQLYKYIQYYNNTELDAKIIRDNGDGTTTYQFVADTGNQMNTAYIYRVSMEGKITKSGWLSWNQQNLTVTYTEKDKGPSYRLDDYSLSGEKNSAVTEDSVLLNGNSRNHLNLFIGQTRTLKAYRAWEIIAKSYQNYIISPDFTYTIIHGDDVVSLTEKDSASAGEGDWMTLTALKEGIAVIEVTYDAIEIAGGDYDGVYGASDPNRTGLLVVQVGENDDTTVKFGIDSFSSYGTSGSKNISYNPDRKKEWDSEFDTLYFTESRGILTMEPTASTNITEVSVSHDKGVNWITLYGENGVYNAEIVPGNNIIRVKTESGTAYQVVRGDKVTVKLTEVSDKSDGDGIIEAGETIRVALVGLHSPIPKMSGNYNPGFGGNNDGYSSQHLNYTCNGTDIYGLGLQYNFITGANFVEVLMPDDGSDVTLSNGYIGAGILGLANFSNCGDSHRNIPDDGCGTRAGETTFHTQSILPEIFVKVGDTSSSNNAPIVRKDAVYEKEIYADQNFAINLDTLFTDPDGDVLTFTVSVNGADAAEAPLDFKFTPTGVGTNTLLITATDGIETAQHTITVTVTKRPSQSGSGNEIDNKFGLNESEIAGYVTISFTDKGVRVKGESGLKYPKPLGTIISSAKVPYKKGEKITHVTKRLLDHLGMRMSYTGTLESGFYLGAICDFEINGTPYDSMGEFDAGVGSGWMITLNKTFIKYGASEFKVKNGDVIKWQYTCQYGKDIGDTFYSGSSSSSNKDNKTEEEKKDDTDNQANKQNEDRKEEAVKNIFTENTFSDIKKDDWHYESVKYVYENNIMLGTDKGFEPESKMTRAMLVTVLYRMTNPDKEKYAHNFTDVLDDRWYSDAVAWAAENNVVRGVGENKFAPDDVVTREQMALIIYRYAKMQGFGVNESSNLENFTDVSEVSDWALEAIGWANCVTLIKGTSDTTLSPKDTATRVQAATILARFNENLSK